MRPPLFSFLQSPLFHYTRGHFESPRHTASHSEGQTPGSPVRNLACIRSEEQRQFNVLFISLHYHKHHYIILTLGTEVNHETICRNNQPSSRDFNHRLLKAKL
jgi:hypothetical protein